MTAGADSLACELAGVSRRFGRRWALRGVTMRLRAGEVVGVTGPNGSGKSTLLRVVSTSLRPTLGTGSVFGADLVRAAPIVRSRVGFLGHVPGVYDDLTASENLRFAAAMTGADGSPVRAVLERVGLAAHADERVRGFSAGMQRRLALGRMILRRPSLLLLDEPYNNFDVQGTALLNEIIEETRDRGGSALIVVHDRRQAEGLFDRVIDLATGAIASVVSTSRATDAAEWRGFADARTGV